VSTVTTRHPRSVGVLLAAGRGARRGITKQLLPWPPLRGDTTMVEAAFDAVAPHCDDVVVVLGCDAIEVEAALRRGGRSFCPAASDPDDQMLESIRRGLRAASSRDPELVLLHLADVPRVGEATVRRLLEEARRRPQHVVLPEHDGRGGHPVVIPTDVVNDILAVPIEGGLRQYWRTIAERVTRLPVTDPGCVRDFDSPPDYQTAAPG